MASGTRRFSVTFTRALQLSLSWAQTTHLLVLISISLRSILILSSHLCLGLPKGLFPIGLFVKIFKAFLTFLFVCFFFLGFFSYQKTRTNSRIYEKICNLIFLLILCQMSRIYSRIFEKTCNLIFFIIVYRFPGFTRRSMRKYLIKFSCLLSVRTSSFCSLLYSIFSSLLGSNIRLWILFSNTLSLRSSFNVRDHASQPYILWQYYW